MIGTMAMVVMEVIMQRQFEIHAAEGGAHARDLVERFAKSYARFFEKSG